MLQTISIIVRGKVQGVFFRHHTKEQAVELNITGTVENLPDGSVKVIASGSKEQLDKLVGWCRQGPSRSVVAGISVEKITTMNFEDFRILR